MTLRAFIVLTALIIALPVFAHEPAKGPNGGRVAEAGDYHVELVAKGTVVEVFLTDSNDKPVSATGFKGTAILVVGGKSQRIALQSEGDTRLSGKANVVLPKMPKGVVQISLPNGATAQAQFK